MCVRLFTVVSRTKSTFADTTCLVVSDVVRMTTIALRTTKNSRTFVLLVTQL